MLLLHLGGLHALGDVRRHRDDAVAVDAVDVADARRRHARRRSCRSARGPTGVWMRSSSIWSRLRRSSGKRTRMSTALSLSDGRYSVTLTPLVTSCTRGADRVDAGAVFRGLGLVDLDPPVDAGQRQAVVEVADVGALADNGGDLLRGGGQPVRDRARRAGPASACRSAGRRAAPSPRPGCRECPRSCRGSSSMISCAGARVCQSANSNWMTPIVSSLISLRAARLLADAGVDGRQAP